MRRVRWLTRAVIPVMALALEPQLAWALSSSAAKQQAERSIGSVEVKASQAPQPRRRRYKPPTVAERIAAGDLLMRTNDYERAVDELNKVIELSRQQAVPEATKVDGM